MSMRENARSQQLRVIPAQVRSLDGQIVDTSGDSWAFQSSFDGGQLLFLSWAALKQPAVFAARAIHCVKIYLADRLTRKKPRTVANDFGMFLRFGKWLASQGQRSFDWRQLTEGLARGFLAHGMTTADKGNDFSRLRTFFDWSVAHSVGGFDPSFLRRLQAVTAVGNAKGHHVRFRDAVRGPFSPDELLLIRRAIVDGKGTDVDRAGVMLHLELGHNALATIRLKNRDLLRFDTNAGIFYQLDVPRVKKRTAQRETKRRPISQNLGDLLTSLRQGGPNDPLFHWFSSSRAETDARSAMRRFSKAAGLVSPRTGQLLTISPRRFRFTIATHMAEEGASLFHIAEVLDHSDTQNVRVYVETASSITEPVAKATDSALEPLVKRFQGKIVDSAGCSQGPLIPASAPHLGIDHLDVGGIGLCGLNARADGPCRLLPPISCYLCPSFAALRDGPHEQMLHSIETFLASGGQTNDKRILMQLEDVRAGILQVVSAVRTERESA
jgi:integrase